ncbi:GH116 family glycosyl hydrolase [Stygiolobus caldivivus]|uniref:Beta-glucosidase n=1 Tax=Stygiolobus caldivivus TaxID=2824673 RepID=A0A8D5U6R7_9CREN|nr:GH116 family glycosyl hydrolase [Stygiolobus caldivivus]BCU70027.1 hypothetical protein KN1_13240 [Stygiolobus caldivivus]
MKYIHSYVLGSGVPLGGLGTGSLELRADGRLYEWTIFNNGGYAERQEFRNTYYITEMDSFIVAKQSKVRLLQGYNYYHGSSPYALPWLRPVRQVEFVGEPPLATAKFIDDFTVDMRAFSPFIPLDTKNSSLPVAVFTLSSTSPTEFVFGIKNPFEGGSIKPEGDTLTFSGNVTPGDPRYRGELCLSAIADEVSGYTTGKQPDQYFWGRYKSEGEINASEGHSYGLLRAKGREVTFLLSWYFPNHVLSDGRVLGHYYENFFTGCKGVNDYVRSNLAYLRDKTVQFHDLLYRPKGVEEWVADLVGSQLTTLVKSTWFGKDGWFGIWEGYYNTADERKNGIYPYTGGPVHTALNTIDVLTYAIYSLLVLFPDLAKRVMLQTNSITEGTPEHVIYSLAFNENRSRFLDRLEKDPSIPTDFGKLKETVNEIVKETGKDPKGRVAHYVTDGLYVDGYQRVDLNPEFVLMWYLISKMTGDTEFLRGLYEKASLAIETTFKTQTLDGLIYHSLPAGLEWIRYVYSVLGRLPRPDSSNAYGLLARDLLPLSIQTYDDWTMLGISSFTSILWIASLQAFNEASEVLGKHAGYEYEKLVQKLEEYLWNGEYFDLWFDPLSGFRDKASCASQLLGHWYSTLLGAKFLEDEIVKKALESIIKYNLKEEEGVINGAYPDGYRPLGRAYRNPLNLPSSPQFDTPWSGVEFYVASHLVMEGKVEDAKRVLREVYDRYAVAGNFWDHLEWGSHYMRPLSALTLVPAFEGLTYDGFSKTITITPPVDEITWALLLPSGWGKLEYSGKGVKLEVIKGEVGVKRLRLKKDPVEVRFNGEKVGFKVSGAVELEREVIAKEGDEVQILFAEGQ